LCFGENEGLRLCIIKGKQEGKREVKIDIAKVCFQEGYFDITMKLTRLSRAELEALS